MIKSDFHMHSNHSGDSEAPMRDMIQSAIDRGLEKICFTEHNDPDFVYRKTDRFGMFDLDYSPYAGELTSLKSEYESQIRIGFGVELGVQPGIYEKLSSYVSNHPFDFVISSSHLCRKKDPYWPDFYEGISIRRGILDYFEEILENVTSYKDFDIYGHLDYVVRYISNTKRENEYTYRFDDFKDVIEAILKTLIANGKGIEINTSALKGSISNTNPCPEIIRFYKELGGEIITVGSDAHKPEHIAYGFDAAERILTEAGFSHYCTFEERKPLFHDLGR